MAARQRQTTDTVQLKLRFKEELRADLEKAAKRRGASLNSEIVERLRASFDVEGAPLKVLAEQLGGTENAVFHLALAHEIRKLGDRSLPALLADPAIYARFQAAVLETLALYRRTESVSTTGMDVMIVGPRPEADD